MKRNPGILIKGACCALAAVCALLRAVLIFECFFFLLYILLQCKPGFINQRCAELVYQGLSANSTAHQFWQRHKQNRSVWSLRIQQTCSSDHEPDQAAGWPWFIWDIMLSEYEPDRKTARYKDYLYLEKCSFLWLAWAVSSNLKFRVYLKVWNLLV